jgi:hypothetical protein
MTLQYRAGTFLGEGAGYWRFNLAADQWRTNADDDSK